MLTWFLLLQGWKGTCILTWHDKDVQEWLESKIWRVYFPERVPDAETLAIRTKNRFTDDIKDHGVAQDIFDTITVNLMTFRDAIPSRRYESIMEVRGEYTPCVTPYSTL